MSWLFLAVTLLLLVLFVWLRHSFSNKDLDDHWVISSSGHSLYDQLAISSHEYRIIGHDLDGRGKTIQISAFGIMGKPDVVAEHRRKKRLRVYDLKSRNYRGQMTDYERFQMTLYIGILKALHPDFEVEGFIRYRDKLVRVFYSHQLFLSLIDLRSEAIRSIHRWKPVNKTPLLARRH